MLLHSPSRLKKPEEREREGEKDAREILWHCFFSPSPSPSPSLSLPLPGKASDISRQKTNSVSPVKSSVKAAQEFFFSPPPPPPYSRSLGVFASFSFPFSVFASFPWMQSCEGRLHAFQTITVHPHSPPPPAHCKFPLCQNPTHASTSFGEPWTDNKRWAFSPQREKEGPIREPLCN